LQAKVSVLAVNITSTEQLAGKYENPPKELIREWGGSLEGDELYLFPDCTYIYREWSDVSPLRVEDKGTWVLKDGYVELKSDPDVTWDPWVERRYMMVRRKSHRNEVLLIGTGRGLSFFESDAGDDPEGTLLVVAKGRDKRIKRSNSAKLKAKIMAESWRPQDHQVEQR
jgi:hypothetical protein